MTEHAKPRKRLGGRKPGQANVFSAKTISRDVGLGMLMALNHGGSRWPDGMPPPEGISPNAIDFWLTLKRKAPLKFADCLTKLIKRNELPADPELKLVVQQITVQASPIPGVLASPVAEHVHPLRLVANGGEVIDAPATEVPSDG